MQVNTIEEDRDINTIKQLIKNRTMIRKKKTETSTLNLLFHI
jgi:hypothetical protein